MADEAGTAKETRKQRLGDSDRRAPESPGQVGKFATLKRTVKEFSEDNMTDWAAALVYYGLLALFPALIAFVGIIGFFVDPATAMQTITDIVSGIGPQSAADTFADPIRSVTSSSSTSGILAIVGIVVALWSASGYVGAFMRASNI